MTLWGDIPIHGTLVTWGGSVGPVDPVTVRPSIGVTAYTTGATGRPSSGTTAYTTGITPRPFTTTTPRP